MFGAFTFGGLVSFLWDNWQGILAGFLALVASASLLIKALEGLIGAIDSLVKILVGLFPGLQAADGELQKAAAALDAVGQALDSFAKSSFLNRLALTPKHAMPSLGPVEPPKSQGRAVSGDAGGIVKGFALVVGLGLSMLWATPAHAQLVVSAGPSIPVLEIRKGGQVSVPAGAGAQLSLSLTQLQMPVLGQHYDMLALDVLVFGSLVKGPAGGAQGVLQGALALCTLNSLLCGGGGRDILGGPGDWFGLLAVSFNFGLAPSPSSSLGASETHARGNTILF